VVITACYPQYRFLLPAQVQISLATSEDLSIIRELWLEYWGAFGLAPEFQGFADEIQGLPGKYAPPDGPLFF
jgi:hypothetical protein